MRKALMWCLALLLFGFACYYFLRDVSWQEFGRITSAQLFVLTVSTFVMIVLHALGAAALLRGLGHTANVWPVLGAMLAASTVGLAGDPKLGVPARLAFYRLLAKIPISVGTAATVMESILWLLLMGLIVAIPGPLAGQNTYILSALALSGVLFAVLVMYFGLDLFERIPFAGRLLRKLGPIRNFIVDTRSSFVGVQFSWLFFAVVWLALTYVVDVWSIWYVLHSLGSDIDPVAIGHSIVVSYLAGAASMIPLGLGVRDTALILLFEQAGATPDIAAVTVVLHRLIRTVLPLVLGFLVVAVLIGRSEGSLSKLFRKDQSETE
ncbi:MAG: lysylphosphatidylglycerol synthase domain-containing protein [Pseudomonadota bacterium]